MPLVAINRESAREKSIRHGHPSMLHIWWARRPLAACRAVVFAQMVDDPSSHPDLFPTAEAQAIERQRLLDLISQLVVWENSSEDSLLRAAREEIRRSNPEGTPLLVDPFAGGGSIPIEAQRLGLQVEASDLNPVAVLINKALVEIPPRWVDTPPVFPGSADSGLFRGTGLAGLAEDIRRYGTAVRDSARNRCAAMYPNSHHPDGTPASTLAWIWSRTCRCPNPACGAEVICASTWWLSRKAGKLCWITPRVEGDSVQTRVTTGTGGPQAPPKQGRGAQFKCLVCGDITTDAYVKGEGLAGRLGRRLLAVVAGGDRQRFYLNPTPRDIEAASIERPDNAPQSLMPTNPRWFSPPAFGMTAFADVFTDRQLVAINTLIEEIARCQAQIVADARAAAMSAADATAYAEAVTTYLGLALSRVADMNNSLVQWSNARDQAVHLFGRQAIPMVWDFAEVDPFAGAAGDFAVACSTQARAIEGLRPNGSGHSSQRDATALASHGVVITTDPPYYDNIGYADLSDFFYVWLRRSMGSIYPDLTRTLLTPKMDELVAAPDRFNGKRAAETHFRDGLQKTFEAAALATTDAAPVVFFYAFKQAEVVSEGTASTGWETMLSGLLRAGFAVVATWPMRTERDQGLKTGTNVLASSVVLVCRRRAPDTKPIDRREFLARLRDELPEALRDLQQASIAPVDLPQAAIGPGMAVFSRYPAVLEANGDQITVRAALAAINTVLDEALSNMESDFDSATRFAIAWYRQHGYNAGSFGDANNLANARNTAVDAMERNGILTSRGGKVQLIKPSDLDPDYDVINDLQTSAWEVLHHLIKALDTEGIVAASEFLRAAASRPDGGIESDLVKELAHLLFRLAESNGWAKDALSFNGLVASWPEIVGGLVSTSSNEAIQDSFAFDEETES